MAVAGWRIGGLADESAKRTENIPGSAQDGLVWRGRRGGVHGAIVVIVVIAVCGVAANVVEDDAGIEGDSGRGT